MKITELDIPEGMLTEKYTKFYKAFPFVKEGEDLKINENVDMLALTERDAIIRALKQLGPEELFEKCVKVMPESPAYAAVAIISVKTEDLKNKDLVEGDEAPYFQDGIISMTIKNKDIKIDVKSISLTAVKVEATESGDVEIKTLEYSDDE